MRPFYLAALGLAALSFFVACDSDDAELPAAPTDDAGTDPSPTALPNADAAAVDADADAGEPITAGLLYRAPVYTAAERPRVYADGMFDRFPTGEYLSVSDYAGDLWEVHVQDAAGTKRTRVVSSSDFPGLGLTEARAADGAIVLLLNRGIDSASFLAFAPLGGGTPTIVDERIFVPTMSADLKRVQYFSGPADGYGDWSVKTVAVANATSPTTTPVTLGTLPATESTSSYHSIERLASLASNVPIVTVKTNQGVFAFEPNKAPQKIDGTVANASLSFADGFAGKKSAFLEGGTVWDFDAGAVMPSMTQTNLSPDSRTIVTQAAGEATLRRDDGTNKVVSLTSLGGAFAQVVWSRNSKHVALFANGSAKWLVVDAATGAAVPGAFTAPQGYKGPPKLTRVASDGAHIAIVESGVGGAGPARLHSLSSDGAAAVELTAALVTSYGNDKSVDVGTGLLFPEGPGLVKVNWDGSGRVRIDAPKTDEDKLTNQAIAQLERRIVLDDATSRVLVLDYASAVDLFGNPYGWPSVIYSADLSGNRTVLSTGSMQAARFRTAALSATAGLLLRADDGSRIDVHGVGWRGALDGSPLTRVTPVVPATDPIDIGLTDYELPIQALVPAGQTAPTLAYTLRVPGDSFATTYVHLPGAAAPVAIDGARIRAVSRDQKLLVANNNVTGDVKVIDITANPIAAKSPYPSLSLSGDGTCFACGGTTRGWLGATVDADTSGHLLMLAEESGSDKVVLGDVAGTAVVDLGAKHFYVTNDGSKALLEMSSGAIATLALGQSVGTPSTIIPAASAPAVVGVSRDEAWVVYAAGAKWRTVRFDGTDDHELGPAANAYSYQSSADGKVGASLRFQQSPTCVNQVVSFPFAAASTITVHATVDCANGLFERVAISENGVLLAYSGRPASQYNTRRALYAAARSGGAPVELTTSDEAITAFAPSPDGAWVVAAVRRPDASGAVLLVSADGKTRTEIRALPKGTSAGDIRFVDAKRVLFTSDMDYRGRHDLFTHVLP